MKKVRLPTADGGDWWVIAHPLSVDDRHARRARPIHVLTLAAQTLVLPAARQETFMCSMALENKLFAVRHTLQGWTTALPKVGDAIYAATFVQDYDYEQEFFCALEAFLNALYSALEVASGLNRLLTPKMPRGFRRQAKKYQPFSFDHWPWLPMFFDLRSQLTHYGSCQVSVPQHKLVIDFTAPGELEVFEKARYEIDLLPVLNFGPSLFRMLDEWAVGQLTRADPAAKVNFIRETSFITKPTIEEIPLAEYLKLVKPFMPDAPTVTPDVESPENPLAPPAAEAPDSVLSTPAADGIQHEGQPAVEGNAQTAAV